METINKPGLLPLSSHTYDQLTIPCLKCEDFINVRAIQKHRELHRVLKIFRCSTETIPRTLKQLLKKRRQLINDAIAKADSEHPVPANIMRRIDWAFEILKKQIAENETSQFQLDSFKTWSSCPIQ